MSRIGLLLFMIFLCGQASGQITFQRTIGGTGSDVAKASVATSTGGFITAGYSSSFGNGWNDFYLTGSDAQGNPLWTKVIDVNGDDGFFFIDTTSQNRILAVGETLDSSGLRDVRLLLADTTGNPLWMKTYGGVNDDRAGFVHQHSSGGFFLGGETKSYGQGNFDAYLIRTNNTGDTMWTKTYGSAGDEFVYNCREMPDRGLILCGRTNSFSSSDDFLMMRTDSMGNILWSKRCGSTGIDVLFDVRVLSNGKLMFVGYTNSYGAGMFDYFVMVTNFSGNVVWSKTYGGTNNDYGYSFCVLPGNEFAVAGATSSYSAGNSDYMLMRIDSSGNLQWANTYGGSAFETCTSVIPVAGGGFLISGMTTSFGMGSSDVFLVRTDSVGFVGCNTSVVTPTVNSQNVVAQTSVLVTSAGCIPTSPSPPITTGGTPQIQCLLLGESEPSLEPGLMIVPNPNSGNFQIRLGNELITDYTVSIYSTLGALVWTRTASVSTHEEFLSVDAGIQTPGLYQVILASEGKLFAAPILIR